MSTVFASDVSGWDDDDCWGGMRMITPNDNANLEGYSGTPTRFKDLNSKEILPLQKKYEEQQKNGEKKYLPLIKKYMSGGVITPCTEVVPLIVAKLKEIVRK